MLGMKISMQSLQGENSAEGLAAYEAAASWCNENGATIEEKDGYYEVVPLAVAEQRPAYGYATVEERLEDVENALVELASIITEGE